MCVSRFLPLFLSSLSRFRFFFTDDLPFYVAMNKLPKEPPTIPTISVRLFLTKHTHTHVLSFLSLVADILLLLLLKAIKMILLLAQNRRSSE
jgi:hypothetical protein